MQSPPSIVEPVPIYNAKGVYLLKLAFQVTLTMLWDLDLFLIHS